MTDRVPLPEPAEVLFGDCFTADQLLAYGNARAAAARREALEEATEHMKSDAETWGPALNDAGWEFMDSYRRHMGEVESGKLFNMAKTILRDCIGVYVKKATSRAAMKAHHD